MTLFNNKYDWLYTYRYFRQLWKQGLDNPFKGLYEERKKPIYIFGNGPSLKTQIEKMEANLEKYKDYDCSVVNDFVNYPIFEKIKPKYITMSDPLFFRETKDKERGRKAMNTFAEKTDWDMIFFIPYRLRFGSYLEPVRQNAHIKIIPYHDTFYRGKRLTPFASWLFKKGLGNGEFETVVLNAMYAAMMMGYKEINVYGIDHNFFDSLAMTSQNVLCHKYNHFYGEESQWEPVGVSMLRFLELKETVFRGHLIMEKLAEDIGVKIYNCTPNSLVDAYERKEE